MKVVLRDSVVGLGKKGDVVDVANGYARNHLLPHGLALLASKGTIEQASKMRAQREAHEARVREDSRALADKLSGSTLTIAARAAANGHLFGSVTAADIVKAVDAQHKLFLDKHHIALAEPIKQVGKHDVQVNLDGDVSFTLDLEVASEA